MKPAKSIRLGAGVFLALLLSLSILDGAAAQTPEQSLVEKLNAYIGCLNRLSERAFQSRTRYFSWVRNAKKGPTGKERIIYGTYTIYDTADCKTAVAKANAMEPRDAELEAAATAYADAVGALEPLLKEADEYYTQENYKDDKMRKGKEMHPRLVAAWDAFARADRALRDGVETIQDRDAAAKLAAVEKSEGRKSRYQAMALMLKAKRVLRTQNTEKPDMGAITQALADYEATVKDAEAFEGSGPDKLGSFFVGAAKSFLVSAKQQMRRLRDHVPYSRGDKMMLGSGAGWMVEGSPQRLSRDYNQLVDAYNRGARI